jgi:AcrR family transcriptional regulator
MEQKEYMTLTEVAAYVGIKRTSLYYYISGLEIKTHKFKFDNRAYMSVVDAERIKEAKERPWTMEEKKSPDAA